MTCQMKAKDETIAQTIAGIALEEHDQLEAAKTMLQVYNHAVTPETQRLVLIETAWRLHFRDHAGLDAFIDQLKAVEALAK
jgi:hypothetical protein